MLRGHAILHLPIVYLGANIVTLPGMYRPEIDKPFGGVSRRPPEGRAGCNLRASVMTPFRWSNDCKTFGFDVEAASSSSVRSFFSCIGSMTR